MFKSKLMYASAACMLTLLVAATGAQAASCTEADMTKMNADIMKMTDAAKMDGAMKEMAMAKDMMAKSDNAGCTTHMNNAAKMMPGM